MATRVASILAEIGIDSSKFTSGSRDVMGGIGQMIGGLGSLAPIIGVAATAFSMLVEQMKLNEQAAVESAKADAVLEAVLTSTGGAVGRSADELDAYATSISKASGLDDELVKSSEAVLLTFTQIGRDAFPAATQAAVDMAAVFGGDLQGKMTMVGKAMNDFTGYSALKKSGVSFTQEQLAQIKNFQDANDLIGYQKLILAELANEFGGAAKAINSAGDGIENLKVSTGNLREEMGSKWIPVVRQWNEFWTRTIDDMAAAEAAANNEAQAMQDLGIVYYQNYGYMRDGVKISQEQVDALMAQQRATQASTDRWNALAAATLAAGDASQQTESEIEALAQAERDAAQATNELNTAKISMITSLTGAEEQYNSTHEQLVSERTQLETERAALVAQGYGETSTKIKDIDQALADNSIAADENAAAHELATKRILLGYIEQKLTRDGLLDDAEMKYLTDLGVAWGVYSLTAVKEMQAAMAKADELTAHLNGIPRNISVHINVSGMGGGINVNATGANVGGSTYGSNPPGGANGLEMDVPSGYSNDTFPVMASSGEHVSITKAGQGENADPALMNTLAALMMSTQNLPNAIARALRQNEKLYA